MPVWGDFLLLILAHSPAKRNRPGGDGARFAPPPMVVRGAREARPAPTWPISFSGGMSKNEQKNYYRSSIVLL
jgi:hypothetical protein